MVLNKGRETNIIKYTYIQELEYLKELEYLIYIFPLNNLKKLGLYIYYTFNI